MAWSVLQSLSSVTGSAVPTSNLSSGSKLILFASLDTSVAGVTWTANDGNGNNFGSLFNITAAIGSGHNYLPCLVLDTPVGDVGTKPTITITPSGGSGEAAYLLEVSGLLAGQTTAILDGTQGSSSWTTQATATDPTYSSTLANEFLVQAFNDNFSNAVQTAPTGYAGNVVDTGPSGGVAWKNSTGGSEAGADWTFSTSTTAQLVKVAFKLAVTQVPRQIIVSRAAVNRAGSW